MAKTDNPLAVLDEIAALKRNWDGYDAPPISPAAIEAARRALNVAKWPEGYVVPTPNGAVQFEWHKGSVSIECEFEEDGKGLAILFFCDRAPSGITAEEEIELPASDDAFRILAAMVRWVLAARDWGARRGEKGKEA